MGPRFVNVEYDISGSKERWYDVVSMGPRFVNVEYSISVINVTKRRWAFQWGHVL